MWLVKEREREEELKKHKEAQGISTPEEEPLKDNEYKISIWTRLYYSQIFRALIIILAISVMIPVFLLLFLDTTNPEFDDSHTCSVETGYQVLCGEQNTTFEECSSLKCCFNETEKSCYHKLMSYYQYTYEDGKDHHLYKPKLEKTPFGFKNVPVYLNIKKESNKKLMIQLSTVKHEQENVNNVENADYEIGLYKKVMGVEVNRITNKEKLLTTNHGPTIVSERYWEWTVDLYADHLFGMDFLRMPDNETLTRVVYKNAQDHSSVARFMSASSGKFHGLEIDATGPLEVTVTQSRLIVLRAFSGTDLVLRLVTGPTPLDVYQQFRNEETWTPVPKWILGVHVCRDGNFTDIEEILLEVDEFHKTSLFPYDSDCIHENIFSLSKNEGYEVEINGVVQAIKNKKKKFLMSLSPQILSSGPSYNSAKQLNILYKWNKKILVGLYLNESVVYPDYSLPKAEQWFKDLYETEFTQYHPDGLVLRNNWPVNEQYKMKNEQNFQYMTTAVKQSMSNTIPWNSISPSSSLHIDVHNSYGLDYTTVVATQTKSPFILSGAFSKGSPYPALVQNVNASWANFKDMLHKTLSHSLFGGQLFSVPVCGDTDEFSKEINQGVCIRWYLAASTMPLFRISSDIPLRDPSAYNEIKYVKNIMTNAIKMRYSLLPYYYTILSENLPMVRPVFFNFPKINETYNLDEQYMIGDSLMIAHPTLFPIPNMKVYLPNITGGWYEFLGGKKEPKNEWVQIPLVESDFIAFVKAGSIIPMRDEIGNSVEETEDKPLKVVIACYGKAACTAKGKLYSKNSIIVELEAAENTLSISNVEICQNGTPDFAISKLKVYRDVTSVLQVPDDQKSFCITNNGKVIIDYSKFINVYV